MNLDKQSKAGAFVAVLLVLPLFGGCVSSNSTASNISTAAIEQPEPLEEVSYDPQLRAEAVAEIRAKADQPNGELTNAFASGDGPAEPLTKQEQAQRIAEMERNAIQTGAAVEDAELTESQRSIRDLQRKAKSHYSSAIDQIEN